MRERLGGSRCTGAARPILALVVALLALGALCLPSPAGAIERQDPTVPDGPPVTGAEVPSSVPASEPSSTSVDTTAVEVIEQDTPSARASGSDRADMQVKIVIVALLALAVIVTTATVAFFIRTRPSRLAPARTRTHDRGADAAR